MLATKQKPQTAPAADFEAAKARWAEARAQNSEMIEREEGMRLALRLTSVEGAKDLPQHLRDKAEPYLGLAAPRLRKLANQLDDLRVEIADFNPKLGVERELYHAARRRETNRLAGELQPRHRSAVKAMAKALEALSLAIEAETQVRAELARMAPERESSKLPDCSGGLLVGTLADWHSPASEWARNMRKLKILE